MEKNYCSECKCGKNSALEMHEDDLDESLVHNCPIKIQTTQNSLDIFILLKLIGLVVVDEFVDWVVLRRNNIY